MINIKILRDTLRHSIFAGLFLVPFIAFLVSSSLFFPFITTKGFAFRMLVEVLFALWLVLVLFDRSYLPKFSWLLISVGIFVGIIAVADFAGVYPYKSIWSNFERMEGLVTLIHLLMYTIVIASVVRTEKIWSYLFHTSIAASIGIGIYGVAQLLGDADIHQGGTRLDASLGNATYLAVYMLIHIFITAMYFFRLLQREGDQINKTGAFYAKSIFYILTILFQTFILYHTATRGSLLGLIGGTFIAAVLVALFEKRSSILKKGAIAIVVFVLVVVVGFFVVKNTSYVKNSPVLGRFSSISLTETTTKSRFLIWNMALQGAKERPLLGWGQENFNYVFNKYYSPQMYNQEQWFDRTHDVILDWLVAGGVFGLAAYLSMFGSILWYLWFRFGRKEDEGKVTGLLKNNTPIVIDPFSLADKAVLSGLLVAYFIHNLFVFDNLISYILFFTVLAYVAERTSGPASTTPPIKQVVLTPTTTYGFIPVIIIGFCLVFYFVNIPALKTATQLITALGQQSGGPEQNLTLIKQIVGYNSFGTPEVREQLVQLTIQVIGSQTATDDIKQKFAMYTSDQLKAQINSTPNDARYLLFYGIFLSQLGSSDASMYLTKSLEKSPHKQTIIFEIVSDDLRQHKYKEALTSAKQAYDLAPEYGEAVKVYALSAVYAGDQALSDKLIAELPLTDRILDDRFLQAFVAVKQYDRARALLQNKLASDPKNYQTHISAAQTYLQMGNQSQAIIEIQIAEVLNPQIKIQADAFIEAIKAGKVKI